MKVRLSSQDSLVSTGSNQELREELESSLAEVKAAVEDVVRRTTPETENAQPAPALRTPEEATVLELASRPAGSREGIGRKHSMEEVEFRRKSQEAVTGGARPRSVQTPATTPRSGKALSDQEGILLKQSSWGSRKGLKEGGDGEEQISAFVRNKELWEKRTNSTPSSDDERSGGGGNFRGNRDFWEARSSGRNKTPGQTPDLVMDLPAGALASSPPVPAPRPRKSRSPSSDSVGGRSTESEESVNSSPSLSSADTFAADTDTLKKTSTPVAHLLPTPKPRPEPLLFSNTQRSTVVPIRSPGPRTPKLAPKFGSSTPSGAGGATDCAFAAAGTTSSFKPSVRVKPVLQVKPSEIKKDTRKDLK